MKKLKITKHHIFFGCKSVFWFLVGVIFGLFFSVSFGFIFFQHLYGGKIYPGVYINNVNFGGKTENQAISYFSSQNALIEQTTFTFKYGDQTATISAKDIHMGYNSNLLAHQAYSIGRSKYLLSNIVLVFNAYLNGLFLPPSYYYDDAQLIQLLTPIISRATVQPTDALFSFENGRVSAFKLSTDGQGVDIESIKRTVNAKIVSLIIFHSPQSFVIPIPIKVIKPVVSTENANSYGIKELIGSGTSLYQHSIPSRSFNVALAATRMNGVLIPPGDEFSFDKALGDVSSYTGYQQAYVIQNGHTILGDGGGICQVSTTFFRALLHAGLPITERHAHDYRVGYYEEDSPPGIDATVFVPSVDLKFTNDTGHWILVQSIVDQMDQRLTFNLYGTQDGRKAVLTTPVVSNETPPPPDVFNDDPTLPKGVIKQVDFSAWGAHVSFSRTVTKNGQVYLHDIFNTDYRPWQAVFQRGTKET